jgi:methylmalonyl-CoA mutase
MFAAATHEEWLKRAQASVKNSDVDFQNILFGRETGPRAFKPKHGPWDVFAVLDGPDPQIAQAGLDGGATGLVLKNIVAVKALAGLPLHSFAIRNEAGDAAAKQLIAMIENQPLDPARLNISFGLQDATLARRIIDLGYLGPFFESVEASGHASIAEGLASVLSAAVTRLRASDFLSDEQLSTAISIKLFASQDMFQSMAKFRAMRILWGRVLAECKLPKAALNLHGETASTLLNGEDHEHYMLNATAATFGAGLGGASSFTVLPFKTNGEFERRMARNVQNILLHEAHLWRVADPAAGAGYVEHLTQQLCEQAWNLFQKMECGK